MTHLSGPLPFALTFILAGVVLLVVVYRMDRYSSFHNGTFTMQMLALIGGVGSLFFGLVLLVIHAIIS